MYVHRHALAFGLVFGLLGTPTSTFADTGVIEWNDSTRQALAAARELDRPVLLYIRASQCGYCRRMESKTWSDPAVVRVVTQGFVPLKIDGQQNSAWIDRLDVKGFPAVVVLSTSGEVVFHVDGYQSPKQILRRLNDATHPLASKTRR